MIQRSKGLSAAAKPGVACRAPRLTGLARALRCALALAAAPVAWAGPVGGAVTAGQAQVSQAGNLTRVQQQSARAVIDWRSFDIGAREAVEFQQPDAGAITLNRVLGGNASALLGRISANGSVFLVNPSGMLFGEGAQIHVGGLLASTANISNANFMAGNFRFDEPGQAGARIDQRGTLRIADGGIAALVGRQVSNSGFIRATLGKVALAGGDAFVLDLAGDRLVNLILDPAALAQVNDAQGRPLIARVDNAGNIQAGGGRVEFSADTVSRLLDNLIHVQGDVRATTVDARDGVISLRGGPTTDITLGGVLLAGGRGGRIDAAGRDITLASSGQIDLGLGADLVLAATRDLVLAGPLNALRDASLGGASLGGASLAGASLTASAGRHLSVAQTIALNDGALSLSADQGRLGVASGVVLQNGSSAMRLQGGGGVALDRVHSGGAISISSSAGAVAVAGAISAPLAGAEPLPVASLAVTAQQGVTLNGALASGDIRLRSGADLVLGSASVASRSGNIGLNAGGRIEAAAGVGVLAGAGNLSASAGGAIDLQAVLASGDVSINAGAALSIALPLGQAAGAASRSITLDGAADVTLAGARAGSIRITSRNGSVRSLAGAGLLSSGAVALAALGGQAGSSAAPLAIVAGDGAGPAGVAGGASVEGRDGVTISTLVTPGAVLLRSGQGAVSVGSAVAGSAGSALGDGVGGVPGALPTRELHIEAAGEVALAGARTGPGGVTVGGSTAGAGAAGFLLSGGALLSDGDVWVNSSGAITLDALVQAGGHIRLAASAGGLTVGAAGIRSTGAGRGIALRAGADVRLNGDLQANAAAIVVQSTGGGVTALVATPGVDPVATDATLDAGSGVAAQVSVQASGDITLGGVRAAGGVALRSGNGNVLLLSPLGGAATGYDAYAQGYQPALRPDVGTLLISAPQGSVELNGLNLDGLADPHAAGSGLAVTAGRMILSNAPVAVNKGDIVLQAGIAQATDGVYLGSSVFSRGWDSVGSDGVRGGAGSAADQKVGYGLRISGRKLGRFDNNADVVALPGLFTVTLGQTGDKVVTDSEAYQVDVNGVRLRNAAGSLLRVITDGTDREHANDVRLVAAGDATLGTVVLGQSTFRAVAKVEIANNAANFRDADTLVPVSNAGALPLLLIDVTAIGGGVSGGVGGGSGGFIGRQPLAGFSPVLGGLSEAPIRARAAAQQIASTRGIALKLLAFESPQDLATEIWNNGVAFANTGKLYNPVANDFQPGQFQSSPVFRMEAEGGGLAGQVFTPSFSLDEGKATLPAGGSFKLTVKGDLLLANGVHCYPDCFATYTLRRLARPLSEYARIENIEVHFLDGAGNRLPIDPAFGNDWRLLQFPPPPPPNTPPPRVDESPARLNLILQIRFSGQPVLASAGTALGAQIRGSLLSSAGSAFGGVVSTSVPPDPAKAVQVSSLPKWAQAASGGLSLRTTDNPSDTPPVGYLVGNLVVDSSTAGTFDATQRGTRLELFDGVLDTQLGRVTGDTTGAINYIPGFGGIAVGKNSSSTGFSSVGAGVGRPSGGSGLAAVGAASARPVGGAATVGAGAQAGAAPGAPADTGFVLRVAGTDRDALDALPGALTAPAGRVADDGEGQPLDPGPAAQADLGRSASVPGAAANVNKRRYPLAVSDDGVACAPEAITAITAKPAAAGSGSAAARAPKRECPPAGR